MPKCKCILLLNDYRYNIDLIRNSPGPSIRVEVKDLDASISTTIPTSEFADAEHGTELQAIEVTDGGNVVAYMSRIDDPITFIKQGQGFRLVLGHERYKSRIDAGDTVIGGKLLSSVAFKKTRLPTPEEQAIMDAQPVARFNQGRPAYGEQFANKPRWTNNAPTDRSKPYPVNRPSRPKEYS